MKSHLEHLQQIGGKYGTGPVVTVESAGGRREGRKAERGLARTPGRGGEQAALAAALRSASPAAQAAGPGEDRHAGAPPRHLGHQSGGAVLPGDHGRNALGDAVARGAGGRQASCTTSPPSVIRPWCGTCGSRTTGRTSTAGARASSTASTAGTARRSGRQFDRWSREGDPCTRWRAQAEVCITGHNAARDRLGAEYWKVIKDKRGKRTSRVYERYPESDWRNLDIPEAIMAPGPGGAVATNQMEALREGVQECEGDHRDREGTAGRRAPGKGRVRTSSRSCAAVSPGPAHDALAEPEQPAILSHQAGQQERLGNRVPGPQLAEPSQRDGAQLVPRFGLPAADGQRPSRLPGKWPKNWDGNKRRIMHRRVGGARKLRSMVRCANRSRTATNVSKGSTPCVTHHFPSGSLHAPYSL